MITVFDPISPGKESVQTTSAVLVNASTNTFEFVLDRKARPGVVSKLTLQDRRELTKTRLSDEAYFSTAKEVYAAGGGINEIHGKCGKSLSYAEKVHAAFERACK